MGRITGTPVERAYALRAIAFALAQPGALQRWGQVGCEMLQEYLKEDKKL